MNSVVDPSDPTSRMVRRDNLDEEELWSLLGQSRRTDRWLAANPRSPGELLEHLSRSKDSVTRRYVVRNANTPSSVLLGLAPTYPGDFFLNPQFDLLMLEDPNLLDRLPPSVFRHILKHSDCPASLIDWVSRHGSATLQLALAGRESVPLEALNRIAKSRHVKAAELAGSRLLGSSG